MNKLSNIPPGIDLDDPRFRIKPYQQIIASCTGAFITSIFGKFIHWSISSLYDNLLLICECI